MRAVIQRVIEAVVVINQKEYSRIKTGLLVLLGVEENDSNEDLEWLAKKILSMRIFGDDDGKMNLALEEVKGDLMIVSQFTLYASTKKGNRPSFIKSARPELANVMYELFIQFMRSEYKGNIETGVFGEDMKVHLVNDGPVTIIIDSKQRE